jgi:hypothetical protein
MNNLLNTGLLAGNLKGDVQVVISVEPGSAILLALLIMVAIVLATLAIKVIR